MVFNEGSTGVNQFFWVANQTSLGANSSFQSNVGHYCPYCQVEVIPYVDGRQQRTRNDPTQIFYAELQENGKLYIDSGNDD